MVRRSQIRDTQELRGIAIDSSEVVSNASDVDLIRRRRQQIVSAAVALFSRRGFYRTTVQDIAVRAKVSTGLIYHYARTKEDLLLLALLHVLDSYREKVPAALKGVKDPLERIYAVQAVFCRIVAGNLDATVLVYRSTNSLPPARRALIKEREVETNEFIAAAIRDCIAASLFREVDVDFVAYQFVMNVHMWALKNWHFKVRFDIDGYIEASFDFFVHALATPKGLKAYHSRKAGLPGFRQM